ncbi:MAG: hypothetical protein RL322_2636 [Pseudomonadota bacterium]|jgi:hypothetical protein
MFRELVALNSNRHWALRIRPQTGFEFARGVHLSALMQAEFVRAAATYPIVFVEDPAIDSFRPMALLGLREGENVFVDTDGTWLASYVPAVIRGYPFVLVRAAGEGESERFAVCIDAGSELLSLTDGARLFDASGQPTEALEQARQWLQQIREMQLRTDAFCRALAARNLFTPFAVRARRGDEALEVNGCYVINEERLDGLPDAKLCELRQHGWLSSIYAHLVSLQQFERLEDGPPNHDLPAPMGPEAARFEPSSSER